jgi:hypothetical protein
MRKSSFKENVPIKPAFKINNDLNNYLHANVAVQRRKPRPPSVADHLLNIQASQMKTQQLQTKRAEAIRSQA